MAPATVTKQRCYVSAEKKCTKFEWSLKDFSLLYPYYRDSFESSEFVLNEKINCSLCLKITDLTFKEDVSKPMSVDVLIFFKQVKKPIDPPSIFSARVSIVGLDEEKLTTTRNTYRPTSTFPSFITIPLKTTGGIEQYLIDDTLTLLCEINTLASIKKSPVSTGFKNLSFSNDTSDNFKGMYRRKEFSDLTFVVEDKKLYAHKFILAANSNVFKAMFSTGMKEKQHNVVNITDTKFDPFDTFLEYMYTGKIEKMEEFIEDLVILADKYQVMGLKNLCIQFMVQTVNTKTAPKYVSIADKISCNELKEKATSYIN